MSGPWFEVLRPLCEKVCAGGGHPTPVSVLLFYVSRWCQKAIGDPEPSPQATEARDVLDMAERIALNLTEDGHRVDRLFEGDGNEWTDLKRLLVATARPRCHDAAEEFADEALQKIAVVLIAGTPPSRAEEGLADGPTGPSNEYVFSSPFLNWARTILINLILDEHRRAAREGPVTTDLAASSPQAEHADVELALAPLPSILDAIRKLPRVQHRIMVLTLGRRDVDEVAWEKVQELAPDLTRQCDPRPASDMDIAARLGSTPHRVAASRSAARKKLLQIDPTWVNLLDAILPHKSTKPLQQEHADG